MPIPSAAGGAEPRQTAKERVYNVLRDWIVEGTLVPGEKVNDMEIAAYFGVSRTPVREAIQLLADQRLIDIFPGRESRVAPTDQAKLLEVYIIMAELHALAVRFAYDKITPEHILELEQVNERMAQAWRAHDREQIRAADEQFHQVFFRLADNDFLSRFANTLLAHVRRMENLFFTLNGNSVTEHEALLEALRKKDLELAVTRVKENWLNTADILAQHFAEERQDP